MSVGIILGYLRITQLRNNIMVQPVKVINPIRKRSRKQKKRSDYVPVDKEAENVILFERLKDSILSEKLYLNSNIFREDLCRIIGVEKNRFAKIIRQNTGMDLTGYMNTLRLNYAIQLMKEHPQYIIYNISIDSGFPNVRTFYQSFHKRFGVTPAEYRKSLKKID